MNSGFCNVNRSLGFFSRIIVFFSQFYDMHDEDRLND